MKTNIRVRRNGGSKSVSPQVQNPSGCVRGGLVKQSRLISPKEFRVVALRECLPPDQMQICNEPHYAADYWRANIINSPLFNQDRECLVVLILNTRRRCVGHFIETIGTRDTLLVDVGSLFRGAIIANASAIILMHNHPSGEASPSEADIKATRDVKRAGDIIRLPVLDHVIMGRPMACNPAGFQSLMALGYFSF
jgi:hypothetical protein